jgi:hypothetical protein
MQDGLYGVLRSVDNLTGLMPAGPPAAYMTVYPYGYSFSAVDVARLSAWVAAGFLDN